MHCVGGLGAAWTGAVPFVLTRGLLSSAVWRLQVYKTPHKFTWATVRGAGHMAPLFHPLRLLDLFDRFIHNKAI